MTQTRIISLDELTARQEEGRVTELWNVLTDDFYTGELIPGSRRVPLDQVGKEAAGLPEDADIVVYCSGTTCPQSKAAGEELADLGFVNTHVFEGGLEAWKEAGRPVEHPTPSAV